MDVLPDVLRVVRLSGAIHSGQFGLAQTRYGRPRQTTPRPATSRPAQRAPGATPPPPGWPV